MYRFLHINQKYIKNYHNNINKNSSKLVINKKYNVKRIVKIRNAKMANYWWWKIISNAIIAINFIVINANNSLIKDRAIKIFYKNIGKLKNVLNATLWLIEMKNLIMLFVIVGTNFVMFALKIGRLNMQFNMQTFKAKTHIK